MRHELPPFEATPPDHALQRLQRRAFDVAVHEIERRLHHPLQPGRIVDGGVGQAGLGGQLGRGSPHRLVAALAGQEVGDVILRVGEEHVVDERNGRRRSFDVEQDRLPVKHDHVAGPPADAIQAGPKQSGSKPACTPSSR